MAPNLVRAGSARRTETPNAVMTTLASPSQGPTTQISMWLVEMHTGQRGPSHVFDTEQVLHLVEGQASVAVDGAQVALAPGDTLVIPEGTERQVFAATSVRMVVCSRGDGIVSVPGETEPRGVPPWIG